MEEKVGTVAQSVATLATDWRYDPFIRYAYNSKQTEAERLALSEATSEKTRKTEEQMNRRRAKLESRLKTAPPELPGEGWLNSEPLTWNALQGKVVVLHFWDVNCGPCQNELPFLTGWHKNAAKFGIVVIGIHAGTDDLEAVRAKMKEFSITYPVLIDGQSGDLGTLHDWFGVTWWPCTILIDKNGKIAAHGQVWLGEIPEQMRNLAAEE